MILGPLFRHRAQAQKSQYKWTEIWNQKCTGQARFLQPQGLCDWTSGTWGTACVTPRAFEPMVPTATLRMGEIFEKHASFMFWNQAANREIFLCKWDFLVIFARLRGTSLMCIVSNNGTAPFPPPSAVSQWWKSRKTFCRGWQAHQNIRLVGKVSLIPFVTHNWGW